MQHTPLSAKTRPHLGAPLAKRRCAPTDGAQQRQSRLRRLPREIKMTILRNLDACALCQYEVTATDFYNKLMVTNTQLDKYL